MIKIKVGCQGYIVLVSVIIISLLLITITAALSSANYLSRLNILESEFKITSANLAKACVNYARIRLVNDPQNYVENQPAVQLASDTCTIVSVAPSGAVWPKTIKTRATYPPGRAEQSYTNLTVVLNSDFSVNSWQETDN